MWDDVFKESHKETSEMRGCNAADRYACHEAKRFQNRGQRPMLL